MLLRQITTKKLKSELSTLQFQRRHAANEWKLNVSGRFFWSLKSKSSDIFAHAKVLSN